MKIIIFSVLFMYLQLLKSFQTAKKTVELRKYSFDCFDRIRYKCERGKNVTVTKSEYIKKNRS